MMDVLNSAKLLQTVVSVGRQDIAAEGRVREATWAVLDAACDQLDAALAELERQVEPVRWGRR